MSKAKAVPDKMCMNHDGITDSDQSKILDEDNRTLAEVKTHPTPAKVVYLLDKDGPIREKLCHVLNEGLAANKQVVCDGEVFEFPDHNTRHKFAETILEVINEKHPVIPKGELHYHFTNVLQLVEAYERGDPGAVREAERIFESEGSFAGGSAAGGGSAERVSEPASGKSGQMAAESESVLPGSAGSQADVGIAESAASEPTQGD